MSEGKYLHTNVSTHRFERTSSFIHFDNVYDSQQNKDPELLGGPSKATLLYSSLLLRSLSGVSIVPTLVGRKMPSHVELVKDSKTGQLKLKQLGA